MSSRNTNPSIKCTVPSCTHHAQTKNYCTLNEIKVGACDPTVTESKSTECDSFKPGTI